MSRSEAHSVRVSVDREGGRLVFAGRSGHMGFCLVMPLPAARSVMANVNAAIQDDDDASYACIVGGELSITPAAKDPRL